MKHFQVASFVAVAAMAAVLFAQEQRPALQEVRLIGRPYLAAPVARVESDLVEVGVVVRSRDGHTIPGLARENFVVIDQGHKRELSYFAVEARPVASGAADEHRQTAAAEPVGTSPRVYPSRSIALYFEDYGTNTGDLRQAQVAGKHFINEGLEGNDKVAIFSTSGVFVDYTTDKAKLIATIEKLRAHPKFAGAGEGCFRIDAFQAYQIAVLHDPSAMDAAKAEAKLCPETQALPPAALENLIEAMAEQFWSQVRIASQVTLDVIGIALRSLQNAAGRKLLVLVSSGFNTGTLELEQDRLIGLALRERVVINALSARGLYAQAPGTSIDNPGGQASDASFVYQAKNLNGRLFAMEQAMAVFAQATGGSFFHNNNDLRDGFRRIASIPEVSYVLGFGRPDGEIADGKFHKLKVSLAGTKPYLVQARPGYFAVAPTTKEQRDAAAARERFDREVSGTSVLSDFPVTVGFRQGASEQAGMVTVKAEIHLGFGNLHFVVRDQRHLKQLKVVAALMDKNGSLAAAEEGMLDLALTDATYARMSTSGVNAVLNLDVPAGKYRLRAVAQDEVEGKMSTATVEIDVK